MYITLRGRGWESGDSVLIHVNLRTGPGGRGGITGDDMYGMK